MQLIRDEHLYFLVQLGTFLYSKQHDFGDRE
jgi:hypothetical protein